MKKKLAIIGTVALLGVGAVVIKQSRMACEYNLCDRKR